MITPYNNLLATYNALLDGILSCVHSEEFSHRSCHIALSGGNTPLDFFRFWVAHGADFPWHRVHFWWVDERCVGLEDGRSNFAAAAEFLLKPANIPSTSVHPMQGELQPEQAARNYGMEIGSSVPRLPNGLPCFDLVMLGVGSDGHLASIFPGVPLAGAHPWVGVSRSPDGLARITLTAEVLASAHRLFFLVTGLEKQALLESLDAPLGKGAELPVAQLMRKRPDARWFVTYNT